MSAEKQPPHMRQEADRPDVEALSWIGAATLVVFAGLLIAVVFLLKARDAALYPHGQPPPPPVIGRPEIGMVNQRLFGEQPGAREIQQRAAERLGSYGWVDRDAGLVHLPIDRAVDLVAKGVRP